MKSLPNIYPYKKKKLKLPVHEDSTNLIRSGIYYLRYVAYTNIWNKVLKTRDTQNYTK